MMARLRLIALYSFLFQPMLANAFIGSTVSVDTSFSTSSMSRRLYAEFEKSRVRFSSPLLEAGYPDAVEEFENGILQEKPLLLYLPGFDGTLLAPFIQFPELGTEFDIVGLEIDMSDRSTYVELKQLVVDHILKLLKSQQSEEKKESEAVVYEKDRMTKNNTVSVLFNNMSQFVNSIKTKRRPRPLYIIGESFGGILTIQVVLELAKSHPTIFKQNLAGIVLVNPATCYARSKLALVGPTVAAEDGISTNIVRYVFNLASQVLPLFTDEFSFAQLLLIFQAKALPSVIDSAQREAYLGRTALSVPQKLKFMPQKTLQWRLTEWLTKGSKDISNRKEESKTVLNKIPTLIIAGEDDATLPSIDEAQRLLSLISSSSVHVVEGAGHASTCGGRIDLAAVMRNKFPAIAKQNKGRIGMKPFASQGKGEWFGMEPRYDGETKFGLSPLKYWSKELYKPWKQPNKEK